MCPETILERSERHVKSPGNQPPGGSKHRCEGAQFAVFKGDSGFYAEGRMNGESQGRKRRP